VTLIEATLEEKAPINKAPQPLAMSKERDTWYVYLHIAAPSKAEVTIDTEAPTLRKALANAYVKLCNYSFFEAQARDFANAA
jgi:hypothetical protein